jgi:hypothetical protein
VRAFASYGNIFYDSIALFLFYLRDISHAAFLPVLVVLLFAGTFFMFKTAVKKDYPEICSYLKYFIVFSMVVILAISATCPWPAKWAAESRANVRYVCNLLPLFMLFMAIGVFLVRQYLDRHVALVVLLILAVAPQLFSFQSRFYLLEYIREIMAPYRTNYNVVREFFRDKGEKGDFVFIAGDDIPSMVYHLRDKFRFTGLISKNLPNSAQFRNAVENYLVAGTTIPDWIISFGNPPLIFDPALHVDMINNTNEVFALVKNSRINYKMHDLRVYLRGDVVRPDIYLHGFSENKNYGPKQSTFVFERIKSHNQ